MAYELAKAYVQIIPTTKNIKSNLSSALNGDAEAAGDEAGKKSGGKFSSAFATAAKVGAAAVAAIGAAGVALGKQVVSAYGEYEQLAGGTELLFGEASDQVIEKAKSAFETVQMSASDYLQQVNGLSTGLKTALGGSAEAAAELADRVVTAEADVVAATGASQESVQNAFNGIMKSNFTMLDNLQLGIKPTKEGFQEVIDKVNDWNTANGEATSYQIDNLADCQAALVDYIAMQGLAGYAASEGADTIQGSLSSLSGAWSNLIAGLGDSNADIESLVNNVTGSFSNVMNNITPIIENVIRAFPQVVSAGLNALVTLLPSILQTVVSLFKSVLETITANAPMIMNTITDLIAQVIATVAANLPAILEGLIGIITNIISNLDTIIEPLLSAMPQIIQTILLGLASHIGEIVTGLVDVVLMILEHLPEIIQAIIDCIPTIITEVIQAIISNLPRLLLGIIECIIQIAGTLLSNIDTILEAVVDGLGIIFGAIGDWFGSVLSAIGSWFASVFKAIGSALSGIISNVISFFGNVWSDITSWFGKILNKVGELVRDIPNKLREGLSAIRSVGTNLVQGLWNGINDAVGWVLDKIRGFGSTILAGIKSIFGIHSPSKETAWMGDMLVEGLAQGIENNTSTAVESALAMSESVLGAVGTIDAGMSAIAIGATGGPMGLPGAITSASEYTSKVEIAGGSKMDVVIGLLEKYLPGVSGNIYLDTGALVGGTVSEMNKALGTLAVKAARGMA